MKSANKIKIKFFIICIGFVLLLLPNKSRMYERLSNSKEKRRNFLKFKNEPYLAVKDRIAILNHINALKNKPLISVIMPTYNTNPLFLRKAIESVQAQIYPNWELCIADDASTEPHVGEILRKFQSADPRIKVIFRPKNGHISAASNSALELATGEFIALFDHDDLLHETALYEVAAEINAYPQADIIYSDEDHCDENDKRSGGYFKTDFNPELLLCQNMINHLGVYRLSLIDKIGGFREGYEGSQDYDLVLRAWQATKIEHIRHIPIVLYHWRRVSDKTSYSQKHLEKCHAIAQIAIQDFLDVEGEGAITQAPSGKKSFPRIIRPLPEPAPLVSVIVPTKDQSELLAVCIDGLLKKTDYPNLEIIIIDHESRESKTLALFARIAQDPRVKIIPYTGTFNYSAMNNLAAKTASGSILALLNNDIEMIDSSWLKEMVSHAVRPEIGAVGAKLYYPDGRIQHAGVIVGLGGFARHSFIFLPKGKSGYFNHAKLTRAVSAVTGACLVVRKSVFDEVGGLNEVDLKVVFNDADLCLKIQAAGYRNVFTPFAELIHHESISRGTDNTPEKKARFAREANYLARTWPDVIQNDPYYSPNLTLDGRGYVEGPTRRAKTWAQYLNT